MPKVKAQNQFGYTLIELMVVAAVIGIIAAIAYPSYQSSVRKSARQAAKGVLMEVVSRQEQTFINNKSYAADLSNLGYPANPFYIDNEGSPQSSSAGSIYQISLASVTASTFTLQAVPQNAQIKDTECGTLSITDSGLQNPTSNNCW